MSNQDERTKMEFSKNGVIKAIFFLIAIIGDIVFKVKGGGHIENVILLIAVAIISLVLGIVDFNKKQLSVNEVLRGYKLGDERVINNTDDAAMKIFVYGYILIFIYCFYSGIRFSLDSITIEGLLFIVMSGILSVENTLVNKNYTAATYAGMEQPYYDNSKNEKAVKNRIIATWGIVTAGWIILDVFNYKDTMAGSPFSPAVTWLIVIAVEIVTTIIFAWLDIKFSNYVNRKNMQTIQDDTDND